MWQRSVFCDYLSTPKQVNDGAYVAKQTKVCIILGVRVVYLFSPEIFLLPYQI